MSSPKHSGGQKSSSLRKTPIIESVLGKNKVRDLPLPEEGPRKRSGTLHSHAKRNSLAGSLHGRRVTFTSSKLIDQTQVLVQSDSPSKDYISKMNLANEQVKKKFTIDSTETSSASFRRLVNGFVENNSSKFLSAYSRVFSPTVKFSKKVLPLAIMKPDQVKYLESFDTMNKSLDISKSSKQGWYLRNKIGKFYHN